MLMALNALVGMPGIVDPRAARSAIAKIENAAGAAVRNANDSAREPAPEPVEDDGDDVADVDPVEAAGDKGGKAAVPEVEKDAPHGGRDVVVWAQHGGGVGVDVGERGDGGRGARGARAAPDRAHGRRR